jgi:hypothetical protein
MATSILHQLASSLGRRNEKPNIDLAVKMAKTGNQDQVSELISVLTSNQASLRNDAIKVLYEIGERKPEMISKYVKDFLQALDHIDNRMKWGAMTALSSVSKSNPLLLAPYLVNIVKAMDEGSVITRDHGIYILSHLATLKKHHKDCMELLLEQVEKAPVNQMPMYAEKTAEVISGPYIKRFLAVVAKRKDVLEIPSKARRIEKLVKHLNAS